MVRSAQKGEMENPSPEISKIASTVSKSDVKKMASTKHKGLPEVKESLVSVLHRLKEEGVPARIEGPQKGLGAALCPICGQMGCTKDHDAEEEVKEGVGRAAIGAVLGSPLGPLGSAAGAAIGASMGKKKKVTTGGVKKKPTNYFKADPKVTSSEGLDRTEIGAKERQKFNTFYKKAKDAKAKEQADSTRSDSRRHGIKFSDAKGSGRIRGGKKFYS